jgi:tRNA(Ile)-lysidine synthase
LTDFNEVDPPMQDRQLDTTVKDLLQRCTFPEPGTTLNCAVSGGADSLALMVLAISSGCEVTAFHVDHGLRDASAEEAGIVEAAARRFGASFVAKRVELSDGPNLEARARDARFSVLPADVATGHTMDDQAETVLCNLLRGSGLDGLSAMRAGRRHPILGVRRFETVALCEAFEITWVTDPSNADPRHMRNRIRHELLPLCSEIARRDVVPILARESYLLRDDSDLLDELCVRSIPDPTDVNAVRAAPLSLARRAIRSWLTDDVSDIIDRHPPSLAEVTRVLEVVSGKFVGTEIAGGHRVYRKDGRLGVRRELSGKVG